MAKVAGVDLKIAILGFGPTRKLAPPLDSKEWEFWGMAHDHDAPSFKRIFEMHDRRLWEKLHGCSEESHANKLRAFRCRLTMQFLYDDIPHAGGYPMELITGGLGLEPPQSSIAAIMSHAISHPNVEGIGIWGVDMAVASEYSYQRANMRYLMGYCLAVGIKITLPEGEMLTDGVEPYGSVEWFAKRDIKESRATPEVVEEMRAILLRAAESLTAGALS